MELLQSFHKALTSYQVTSQKAWIAAEHNFLFTNS